MITNAKYLVLLGMALLLAGCVQSACQPGPYLQARPVPPLVIPDGLDAPDRQMALRVPPSQSDSERLEIGDDGCIVEPPAFFAEEGVPNPDGLPPRPVRTAAMDAPRLAPRGITRQVTRFVRDWARAWDKRDFDKWVEFYAPGFVPEGYDSNAAWREEQARLFEVDATTRIERGSMRVYLLADDRVRARFEQRFGLGQQDRSVVKELVLTPGPGGRGWLIAEDYIVEVK